MKVVLLAAINWNNVYTVQLHVELQCHLFRVLECTALQVAVVSRYLELDCMITGI